MDDKGRMFPSHTRTWDCAEPELKKKRLDGSDGDSNSDGSSGGSNSYGSGGRGGVSHSTVFIGNEQDDEYFEEHKHLLEPEHYEKWTQEEKRQYGRYIHQLGLSNCYYLDFFPTIISGYGARPIDFSNEDYEEYSLEVNRCIEVALGKQKEEELELVDIVRAILSTGYGSLYWITMDVRNKCTGEIKTCICKVHHGVKGGAEDDMIVEHFKFIPSNFKYMQGNLFLMRWINL
ncbi:unnamed protein product [Cuscuta campestris]|uniref:Cystatin domain-containing protein n=1 Tax=Cuscuta campestris TaxID=132261 RepID=A0A484LHB7_9ASTE|nr:unnamed protein product [Cuscuta campestris]